MKKKHILLSLGHICDRENLKSTKIRSITAFVHEKNAKYLTKHKFLHILY